MFKKILTSSIVVVSLMAAVGGSSLALFRDTEYIPGNTISTGTIGLNLSNGQNQMPSPIVAQGLMPGEWSDWSRVEFKNTSTQNIKVYFYAIDVNGDACYKTNLNLVTGPIGGEEMQYTLFNQNIGAINGINNKVEITGAVFNPDMPVNETGVVHMRAGIDENAGNDAMNKSCSWTGVFLAEQSMTEEEPPTSFPEEETL